MKDDNASFSESEQVGRHDPLASFGDATSHSTPRGNGRGIRDGRLSELASRQPSWRCGSRLATQEGEPRAKVERLWLLALALA